MRTKAAILASHGCDWEVVDLELDPPGPGEVLLRVEAAGLCHSDEHLKYSDDARFPVVGGHEGAGVIEAVGERVANVRPGDHVICSFIPACGRCRWCSTGSSYLCDHAPDLTGAMADGTFRFHLDGHDLGAMDSLGTFAAYTVIAANACIPISSDVPFAVASLLSCCVPTGWGAAVRAGEVRPGDVVVVQGSGGVGCNAVQGAVRAGARSVIVTEPVAAKRDVALTLGAADACQDAQSTLDTVMALTGGLGADVAIVTAGVVDAQIVTDAFSIVRKGGTIVLIGAHDRSNEITIKLPGTLLTVECKKLVGSLYGNCNPQSDIPMLLKLYESGQLRLDELITAQYSVEDIGRGYGDMHAGKNIRGVIIHQH